MRVSRPEKPQGRHVLLLRNHLGINQTQLGALLDLGQPAVSTWEAPHRRDDFLEPELARRFLEVWDLFPTPPRSGFNEMMAAVAAYRAGHSALPDPTGVETQQASDSGQTWPILLARGPLPPGTKLVEMVPMPPIADTASLTRTFAAVQETPPAPDHEGEVHTGGSERAHGRSRKRGRRIASGALGHWTTAAALVALVLPVGCFQAHREGSRAQPDISLLEQEPRRIPEEVYTNGAAQETADPAEPMRSIKMPEKPYSWQKVAPCDPREHEKIGGCWLKLVAAPPCPDISVEDAGTCYVPIPARPKRRNTLTPEK